MFSSDLTTIAARFRKLIADDFEIRLTGEIVEGTSFDSRYGDYYVIVREVEHVEEELPAEPQLPGHPPSLAATTRTLIVPTDRYRIDFCGSDDQIIERGV